MYLKNSQNHFYNYSSRIKYHQKHFKSSYRESLRDLSQFFKIKGTHKKSAVLIARALTSASVWMSRSSFQLLSSYFDFRKTHNENLKNKKYHTILNCLKNLDPIPESIQANDEDIFKILYQELVYHDVYRQHSGPCFELLELSLPQILLDKKVSLILISGVFNEIFSTPAFQRSADYLTTKYHMKNFSIEVSGVSDSYSNAKTIKTSLANIVDQYPDDQFWFLSFSKGGVDLLHFLKSSPEFHQKILGSSFIASPLMGTGHTKHPIFRFIDIHSQILKKVPWSRDFITSAQQLKKSLDSDFRNNWFRVHHNRLPKNALYTSLAFSSRWYDSHFWMILTKAIFKSQSPNDGVVDVEKTQFPNYFSAMNLGVLPGHHLVGTRSSFYNQEALLEAHLLFLVYKNLKFSMKNFQNA